MSATLDAVRLLVARGEVRISAHGYEELAADNLFANEIVMGIGDGMLVEDYPDYPKGRCVLVLQHAQDGKPVHVVWGIPRGRSEPAVLVTAYRPEANRWTEDFLRRRS